MNEHLYIAGTILFTIYGQIILKWRLSGYGILPVDMWGKIHFFISILLDPFILSSFAAAFVAALCWMAALSKFDLSYAYPFMGSTYILILFLSSSLLNETFTWNKFLGTIFILIGIIISSRSS